MKYRFPDDVQGVFTFSGQASADGKNSPIAGAQYLLVPAVYPADQNPSDWLLTINEVTAYGAAWCRGETWPQPPNPIPMDYVTRAAFLWRGGECYELDLSTNAPLCWVNCEVGNSESTPLFEAGHLTAASIVQRQVAPTYVPGEPLTVTLTASPAPSASAYALEELVPDDCTVSAISHDGELDPVNRRLKWGPFLDHAARTVSYRLLPECYRGERRFVCRFGFGGRSKLHDRRRRPRT